MKNPNNAVIRSIGCRCEPPIDWEAFRRSQEPYYRDFLEMRKRWREDYHNPDLTPEERKEAGDKLEYSRIRIWLHERFGRIFRDFYY